MLHLKNTHICSFQAGPTVREGTGYEPFRAAILEAGKFSVFEVTDNRRAAALFTQLCRDPEIETFDLGYPWTGVREKLTSVNSNA